MDCGIIIDALDSDEDSSEHSSFDDLDADTDFKLCPSVSYLRYLIYDRFVLLEA